MPSRDDDPYASTGFEVANGTDLGAGIGFLARSAIIDNNTSAFCFQPDSGLYVPPRQGRGVAFSPTPHARLVWKAPPGYTQSAAAATEKAQIRFYAAPSPPGGGLASPQLSSLQNVAVFGSCGNNAWLDTGTHVPATWTTLFGFQVSVVNGATAGNRMGSRLRGLTSNALIQLSIFPLAASQGFQMAPVFLNVPVSLFLIFSMGETITIEHFADNNAGVAGPETVLFGT